METLKDRLLEKLKTKRLTIHDCSLCNYPCAFTIVEGRLYYDSGCDCTGKSAGNFEPRETSDLDSYLEQPRWRGLIKEWVEC